MMAAETDQKTLAKLHGVLLRLLNEFHRLCTENDLSYIVTGGTCLGAVRHHGFIPWDDDVDVGMPRKDYDRFIALCLCSKLSEGFTLQVHGEKEPYYSDPFVRLRLDNTLCIIPYHKELGWNHLGVFLDIFPYDETDIADFRKIASLKKKYDFANRLLANKVSKRRPTLASKLLHVALIPFSVAFLERKQVRAIQRFKEDNKKMDFKSYVDLNSAYSLQRAIFPLKLFEDRLLVPFETTEAYIPKEYDAFLTIIYGDYMKVPPKEAQVAHLPNCIKLD